MFGEKEQDRSNKHPFTINVVKSRSEFSKRTTSVPRKITLEEPDETSKAVKDTEDAGSLDSRNGLDSNPDHDGNKKNVKTYTADTKGDNNKGFKIVLFGNARKICRRIYIIIYIYRYLY